jgi:uncharacterized lipoprotein YbaY
LDEAGPTPIASTTLKGPADKPMRFTLPYDAGDINPERRYSIEARVMMDGDLKMLNPDEDFVITQGHPENVTVQLEPTG